MAFFVIWCGENATKSQGWYVACFHHYSLPEVEFSGSIFLGNNILQTFRDAGFVFGEISQRFEFEEPGFIRVATMAVFQDTFLFSLSVSQKRFTQC